MLQPERSLVAALRAHTRTEPDAALYTFIDDSGQATSLTRDEFDARVQKLARVLCERQLVGERALLLYPPGLDFSVALWACLVSGVVAIPAYPPDPTRLSRTLPRLEAILADCEPGIVLTDATFAAMFGMLGERPELQRATWLSTSDVAAARGTSRESQRPELAEPGPDQLALIQYTSGSTSSPKGVMLSHSNLASNLHAYTTYLGDAGPVLVMWLPQYHDMGLIGGLLTAAYLGQHCVYMSPAAFLRRPLRWLQTIQQYRATYTGAPNFAFELCLRRSTPTEREALDLSSLTVVGVGAEPTRAETLRRFSKAFAVSGFSPLAFRPCYGLAEVGVFASGGSTGGRLSVLAIERNAAANGMVAITDQERNEASRVLVGHGPAPIDHERLIVDPTTLSSLDEGHIGEIWLAGPSVALGYWNGAESADAFGARTSDGRGPYLRTGDLGFTHRGELFITGRLKDIIIVRGRNLHAEDVEATVEGAHDACRPGCAAAFTQHDETEHLVVVQEVTLLEEPSPTWLAECFRAIDEAVVAAHGTYVERLYLLHPRTLPKTSSGKVQRRACREALASGELLPLACIDRSTLCELASGVQDAPPTTLEEWIVRWVARRRGVPATAIDSGVALGALGLDSLGFANLTFDLEEHLGLVLTDVHKLVAPVNSIRDLAERLSTEHLRDAREVRP